MAKSGDFSWPPAGTSGGHSRGLFVNGQVRSEVLSLTAIGPGLTVGFYARWRSFDACLMPAGGSQQVDHYGSRSLSRSSGLPTLFVTAARHHGWGTSFVGPQASIWDKSSHNY